MKRLLMRCETGPGKESMNLTEIMSRDERGGCEQMQQMHPIATAGCIILTLAFGLFCLRASVVTTIRQNAAQHHAARKRINVDRPTSTSNYLTPHVNRAPFASGNPEARRDTDDARCRSTSARQPSAGKYKAEVDFLQAQLARLLTGAEFEKAVRQTRASNDVRFQKHHDSK
jgi:hypothetical protein